MHEITGHGDMARAARHGGALDPKTLALALAQDGQFDSFSVAVEGLAVHRPGTGRAFAPTLDPDHTPLPGAVLTPSVLRARRVFADSSVDRFDPGHKDGRLDPRALGRRAWSGDDRLFRRRLRAEGVDFDVVLGLDVSASTTGERLRMIKQAGEGLATVLHRVGVRFAVYAHSMVGGDTGYRQEIYTVKDLTAPWTPAARTHLANLQPVSGSLDGHNLEFYRKVLDRATARRRLIVYFTDGKIPEQNTEEETAIIQREVATCARRGYVLLAVGIGNDSPKNFGLDTVRIDTSDDIVTVVRELESRITGQDAVRR